MNTLRWVHSQAGVESPSSSPIVWITLKGIKRMLAKPVQKKDPVASQMLADQVLLSFLRSGLDNKNKLK